MRRPPGVRVLQIRVLPACPGPRPHQRGRVPRVRGSGNRWPAGPGFGSFQASDGGSVVPAVAVAGSLDELTDGDEGGGEVEEEVDAVAFLVGTAAQFAVAVHPG